MTADAVERSGQTIAAGKIVPAAPEEVFAFLSTLENHWLLADRFVDVLSLDGVTGMPAHGGRVQMRGPLGMRRTATTTVLEARPNSFMCGSAKLSGGTEACVSWTLSPTDDGTEVRLRAELVRSNLSDRILLVLGGRAWLQHRFESILERLAERVGDRRWRDLMDESAAREPV